MTGSGRADNWQRRRPPAVRRCRGRGWEAQRAEPAAAEPEVAPISLTPVGYAAMAASKVLVGSSFFILSYASS